MRKVWAGGLHAAEPALGQWPLGNFAPSERNFRLAAEGGNLYCFDSSHHHWKVTPWRNESISHTTSLAG